MFRRQCAYDLLTKNGEPSTIQKAICNPDASLWMTTIRKVIEALHKNKTWKLVPLPQGRKAIENIWDYKIKREQ